MLLRSIQAAIVCSLVLLSGCADFFPPINGGGGSSTGTNIVYTANTGTTGISAYSMSTGALVSVNGSPYSLTFAPTAIAVNPANTFLYVAGLGVVYAYSIGTGGVLTVANNGTAVANGNVVSMDISPDGNWLFTLDADGASLEQYAINSSNGTLTPASGATYGYGSGITVVPKQVKIAPSGAYVVLALGTAGEIVYIFNTSTGALTESQRLSAPTTTSDNAIAMDKKTAYLFIARSGTSSGTWVYTIGNAGALNVVTGSPFAAGNQPSAVVVDNTATYAYVANKGDGTISAYTIGTNGVLTAVGGSPYTSGASVTALAADSTGKYILAASAGSQPDLGMYAFDTTTTGRIFAVSSTTSTLNPVAVAVTH